MIKSLLLGMLLLYLIQNLIASIAIMKGKWKVMEFSGLIYMFLLLAFGSFFVFGEWMEEELGDK